MASQHLTNVFHRVNKNSFVTMFNFPETLTKTTYLHKHFKQDGMAQNE